MQENESQVGVMRLAGLEVRGSNSALVGSLLLWVLFAAGIVLLFGLSIIEGVTLGLALVLLHWTAALIHQLGHARAAQASGYPMIAVRLWGVLTQSVYPAEEPDLPREVHIKRALGGPLVSALVGGLFGLLLFFLPLLSLIWWLDLFFVAESFLIFNLGALLPLGFTDGSTILRWLRRQ